MQKIVLVILYLAIGWGIYWLLEQLDIRYFKAKLAKRFKDNEVIEEYHNLGLMDPMSMNPRLLVVLFIPLVICVWGAWPLWAVAALIWLPVKYHIICKRHSK